MPAATIFGTGGVAAGRIAFDSDALHNVTSASQTSPAISLGLSALWNTLMGPN